jgi:hypothetical protein
MLKYFVTSCAAAAWLSAAPALAQDNAGPSRWGVAVGFAPTWKVPEAGPLGTLAEKSLAFGHLGLDVAGRDFRAGVVRGRYRQDDWGVSLVHRTFTEGSTQGAIITKCILEISCHVTGTEYRYQDAAMTGLEANRFFSFFTIGNVAAVGVDLAGGLGWYRRMVERRDALNIFTTTSTEPILSSESTQVPASQLSKMKPSLLGRAEVAVAIQMTRELKLRLSGGVNYPGTDVVNVSLLYFFGAN